MSSKNNVNPGQYKVAGREKPGTPLGQEHDKEAFAESKKQERGSTGAAAPKENRKKK
jgi:hypothetical protein